MSELPDGREMDVVAQGPREKRAGMLVIAFGLLTTAVMMSVVFLMNAAGFDAMNIYVFVLFPLGALIVGIFAGSGYGLGSWWTGAKIGGTLLVLVLVWQFLAFFAAQFVEYLALKANMNPPLSFWQYFDSSTRGFRLENGPPLGIWGYGLRLLQITGFTLGGLLGSLLLMTQPYCEQCQMYRKTKQLGVMPAGIKPRKVKKKNAAEQGAMQAEAEEAFSGGLQLMEETAEMAQSGDTKTFCELMQELKAQKKEINKQSTRLTVSVEFCPACHAGRLIYKTMQGHGDETIVQELATYQVGPAFVREVRVTM